MEVRELLARARNLGKFFEIFLPVFLCRFLWSVLQLLVHLDFVLIRLRGQISILHLNYNVLPVVVNRNRFRGRPDTE